MYQSSICCALFYFIKLLKFIFYNAQCKKSNIPQNRLCFLYIYIYISSICCALFSLVKIKKIKYSNDNLIENH